MKTFDQWKIGDRVLRTYWNNAGTIISISYRHNGEIESFLVRFDHLFIKDEWFIPEHLAYIQK